VTEVTEVTEVRGAAEGTVAPRHPPLQDAKGVSKRVKTAEWRAELVAAAMVAVVVAAGALAVAAEGARLWKFVWRRPTD
jgi:hypothetical protein